MVLFVAITLLPPDLVDVELELEVAAVIDALFCNKLRPAVSRRRPGFLCTGLSKVLSLVDFVPTRSKAFAKLPPLLPFLLQMVDEALPVNFSIDG